MTFTCSICGEESARICARCTKDACPNHICEKCERCSDCCECEIAVDEPVRAFKPAVRAMDRAPKPIPEPEPEPVPPQPPPDPDPFPEPETGPRY
jgi:hypothetical protein